MIDSATTTPGKLYLLGSENVAVHPNRCVRVRNRHATCTACADVCTSGAIAFEEGALRIDASLCIGCGTCATACPTCALESKNPTDELLLNAALDTIQANGGQVVVMCARELDASFGHVDESKVVRVTCLGRVDESLIVELAAARATDVAFVQRLCDNCEHVAGRDSACAVCQSASNILAAWGRDLPIEFVDEIPQTVIAQGTLADIDALSARTQSEAAVLDEQPADGATAARFAKVGKNGTLPQHVPNRRGRLLSTLANMAPAPEAEVESRLWCRVDIDTQKCGSCRLCTVFCPTGALVKFDDRDSGTFGVEHRPAKCVACGECRDICPHSAIELREGVPGTALYNESGTRFPMKPRDVEPGKPDTIVRKMRGLLKGSKYVGLA